MNYGNRVVELPFRNRFLAAPLEGFTDGIFLDILDAFGGCGGAFTRFLAVKPGGRTQPPLDHVDPSRYGFPLFVQLLGKNPLTMAMAASLAEAAGYAGIDINAGCPYPTVMTRGCGAALLEEPERLASIVSAVVREVSVPVTVKIRPGTGDDSKFRDVLAAIGESGAAMVTVHPRLAVMKYDGEADWSYVRDAVSMVDIPVCGNGDITVPSRARERLEETGCSYVMVGRAFLSDFEFFSKIVQNTGKEEEIPPAWDRVMEYFNLLFRKYREKFNSDKMILVRLKAYLYFMEKRFFAKPGISTSPLLRSRDTNEFFTVLRTMAEER